MNRVRCPRERTAYKGSCEREGCNHHCTEGARICGCCLVQLGLDELARHQLLRKFAAAYDLARAEDEALTRLNALPPRRPVNVKATRYESTPAAQRRAEWRR